jgi:hypothetical protein
MLPPKLLRGSITNMFFRKLLNNVTSLSAEDLGLGIKKQELVMKNVNKVMSDNFKW